MIETVKTQISFINVDIVSLISTLCENNSFSELDFLYECKNKIGDTDSFESVWTNSVNCFVSPLTDDDKRIIISFGSQLGKSDTNGQIRNCELHINQIEKQIAQAEENYQKYGNLYINLSIISGVMIVIFLI